MMYHRSCTTSLLLFPQRTFLQTLFKRHLSAGIVGIPNVGKSTLFNALTSSALAQASNFPFCTIEVLILFYS